MAFSRDSKTYNSQRPNRLLVALLSSVLIIQLVQSSMPKGDVAQQGRSEEDRQFLIDNGYDPDQISPDTVVIKPPTYTDEEQLSKTMPKIYRCDGCRVLAFQLENRFSAAEKKFSGKNLPESEIIDIVEGLCTDTFESYGLMNAANGDKYLVGDGLNRPKQSGSLDNGPLWGQRLRQMCMEILDLYDEDEIYKMYKSPSSRTICSHYCYNGVKMEL